jgi:hypothetical protein
VWAATSGLHTRTAPPCPQSRSRTETCAHGGNGEKETESRGGNEGAGALPNDRGSVGREKNTSGKADECALVRREGRQAIGPATHRHVRVLLRRRPLARVYMADDRRLQEPHDSNVTDIHQTLTHAYSQASPCVHAQAGQRMARALESGSAPHQRLAWEACTMAQPRV